MLAPEFAGYACACGDYQIEIRSGGSWAAWDAARLLHDRHVAQCISTGELHETFVEDSPPWLTN